MSNPIDYSQGIYDAKKLGTPRLLILGAQHMFAMFGATVLVPLLTGLSVSTTLLCAGLGTLLFHIICKGKVPAFLGSSFAYLGGFAIVSNDGANPENLPYACAAVAFSGLLYVLVSGLISVFGIRRIMRFFPPVVTGPIIISIGLILAPSAITNCQSNWLLAFVALAAVIICNIWGKGMVKILPILIGVLVSYAVALVTGAVDFAAIGEASWIGFPIHKEAMGLFSIDGSEKFISALFTIMPIAVATMMEHIGDIAAISATTGRNYIRDPGLNRTLMGDGLATTMAGLLGGPANTTYGENTGVLALTKIYDPLVIRIAAVFACILSFCPKFEAIINTIPSGIVGGISFVLYGMISAIGVSYLLQNLSTYVTGGLAQAYPNIPWLRTEIEIGGITVRRLAILTPVLTILLVIALVIVIKHTKMGMAMRAVAKDFDTAQLMGIRIDRVISITFVIGSFLAAVGSILYFSYIGQVSPTIGAMPGLKSFVAAVFGGIGSVPGAVIGSYIIGICETFIKSNQDISIFSNAFTFALLIIILLIKPNGLFGEKLKEKV